MASSNLTLCLAIGVALLPLAGVLVWQLGLNSTPGGAAATILGWTRASPSPTATHTSTQSTTPSATTTPPPLTCGQQWPWQGSFDKDVPPFWRPNTTQCAPLPSRPKSELVRCLEGRTVYVMGNSVARGYFYELGSVLTEDSNVAEREKQMQSCDKHKVGATAKAAHMYKAFSCTSEFPQLNISAAFVWRQWMWSLPKLLPGDDTNADMCGGDDVEACMVKYLGKATDRDILLVNMGLITSEPGMIQCLINGGEGINASSPLNNGDERLVRADWPWWEEQTRTFLRTLPKVSRILPNRTMLVTTTPYKGPYQFNYRGAIANAVAAPLFLAAGARVVDMRSVARGQEALFADHVHIPGPLSKAMWYNALAEVCPELKK